MGIFKNCCRTKEWWHHLSPVFRRISSAIYCHVELTTCLYGEEKFLSNLRWYSPGESRFKRVIVFLIVQIPHLLTEE